jgi:BirA family biotin operon repressor/biotin-[acetyl-CoA-carboxylase] ligase
MTDDRGLDAALLTSSSPWEVSVRVMPETGSTNDDLLRAGEEGAPSGTILFAEHQTAGRGQFHRAWDSAPSRGLWFSLLLRMEINDSILPALSAFAAVALVETIRGLGITSSGIKEPNDILITGRKVSGILVETRIGRNPFAVVGIGLNVNQSLEDYPPELRERATSLAMVAGSRFDRNAVAASLMVELGKAERLMRNSREELLSAWNRHLLPCNPSDQNSPK